MKSKDTAIKEVKGFSSAYPNICNLKLLPNIDGTWITIQDDVGTSMTIKLSDLSDFIKSDVLDKIRAEIACHIIEDDTSGNIPARLRADWTAANKAHLIDIAILDKYIAESEDKE